MCENCDVAFEYVRECYEELRVRVNEFKSKYPIKLADELSEDGDSGHVMISIPLLKGIIGSATGAIAALGGLDTDLLERSELLRSIISVFISCSLVASDDGLIEHGVDLNAMFGPSEEPAESSVTAEVFAFNTEQASDTPDFPGHMDQEAVRDAAAAAIKVVADSYGLKVKIK